MAASIFPHFAVDVPMPSGTRPPVVRRRQAVVTHLGPNGEWWLTENQLLGQPAWEAQPEHKTVNWPSRAAFDEFHVALNALHCAEANVVLRLEQAR